MDNIEHYIDTYGIERWLLNGKIHRDDGPAIIYPSGEWRWFRHGKYHRVDGPAVSLADGTQMWFQHGRFHRDDGPAVLGPDRRIEWWYGGLEYSFDNYCKQIKFTPEQILELKVRYG